MKKESSSRWLILDASRGCCCLAVVLFHSLVSFDPARLHPLLANVRIFSQHGWMAVHLFFVLSGWCMAQRLSSSLERREAPASFLLDRMVRIYPVYWAVLALALLLKLLASLANGTSFSSNVPSGLYGAVDMLLLYEFSQQSSYLLVAWSLGVEVLFYAACYFGLLLFLKKIPSFHILAAATLLCALPLVWPFPWCKTFLSAWPQFLWGMLAWRVSQRVPGAAPYAVLWAVSLVPMLASGSTRLVDLLALSFALILLSLRASGVHANHSRTIRLFAGLGTISYSLYLIHVPILSPFLNLCRRNFAASEAIFVLLWMMALVLALTGGVLVYLTVERRFETWRKSLFASFRPPSTS